MEISTKNKFKKKATYLQKYWRAELKKKKKKLWRNLKANFEEK